MPMSMKIKTHALLLVLAALLSSADRAAAQDPRSEILRAINAERQRAGAPPLRLLRPLNEVAQRHAEEIARSGNMRLPRGSERQVEERMQRAGYNAHRWTESLVATPDGIGQIMREWRRRDRSIWETVLSPEVRDVGIGIARMRGTPLYDFLFAVPEAEHFSRTTTGLRDPSRVRSEMLAAVNEVRRKTGAPPLRMNADLQEAAQAHAQDMLARGFFAHKNPSGTTVRERSRKAGYDWRTIGENIAEGQKSVDEVVTTWMNSPGHRANMLNPAFRELGVGLVTGKARNGEYRVIWVQNFGAR